MKKITLIFLSFCGINACFAQKQAAADTPAVRKIEVTNIPPNKQDTAQLSKKPAIRLFPNPAKNKVDVEVKDFLPGYIKLQLIDNKGKLVKEEKRQVFSGDEIIVLMFSEKPGLYFLLVKQGDKIIKSKLIIR